MTVSNKDTFVELGRFSMFKFWAIFSDNVCFTRISEFIMRRQLRPTNTFLVMLYIHQTLLILDMLSRSLRGYASKIPLDRTFSAENRDF